MAPQQWPGLPDVVKSRIVPVGDLDIHILECLPLNNVHQTEKPPLILLLHGFPELGYSWRRVFAPLAQAGYYVVAPDLRGYGLTTPRRDTAGNHERVKYGDDLRPYNIVNVVADTINLVYALGYGEVAAVVGHDFGSLIAGWCALTRPDVFKRLVVMSAPFSGPPKLDPSAELVKTKEESKPYLVDEHLRLLEVPRKHYTVYNSSPLANDEYMNAEEGLGAFLRAYYHMKSADWEGNVKPLPAPLEFHIQSGEPLWTTVARGMEVMPYYYIMPRDLSMPASVRSFAPTPADVAYNTWLPDAELQVYTSIYEKTGFQGGLNYYRVRTDERWNNEAGVRMESGRRLEVPMRFVAGQMDWGTWQAPLAVEAMRALPRGGLPDKDFVIVPAAGHWVQQEQPEEVVRAILEFVNRK